MILVNSFFNEEPVQVAKNLLGKVIRRLHQGIWLSAMVIETEAYYKEERGSHSWLGFTEKRKALFMDPGTIYMYYARGGDSLNISCLGEGNAVLIKAAIPYFDNHADAALEIMHRLNPTKKPGQLRPVNKLCAGQTLLCRSLGIKVPEWNQKCFDPEKLYIESVDYQPKKLIQTTRLGIPIGRDEQLLYRFIDHQYANSATRNPLTTRAAKLGVDYIIHEVK